MNPFIRLVVGSIIIPQEVNRHIGAFKRNLSPF